MCAGLRPEIRTQINQREYVPAQEQRSCRVGLGPRIMRSGTYMYVYMRRLAREFQPWFHLGSIAHFKSGVL